MAMDSAPNGFPHKSPYAAMIARGNISIPPLPDEEQERVDAIVSAMKIKRPDMYEVICYAYITRLSDSRIARKVRHRKQWVTSIRNAAEGYLEAKLDLPD